MSFVYFEYMGLDIQANVEPADHDALVVDEWHGIVYERGDECEIPSELHAFLNENEQFMSGLRQRAVEEAR